MKPDDLKIVARKFVDRYYPDFGDRVDRIWKIFEGIEPASVDFGRKAEKKSDLQGFGVVGKLSFESKDCISGIAVFAFVYEGVKNQDSVSENEAQEKLSIVSLDTNLSPEIKNKLEIVLGETFSSLSASDGRTIFPDREVDSKRSFAVYVGHKSGFGSEEFVVSEEELHNRFLSRREAFDIIVYKSIVKIKKERENSKEDVCFLPLNLEHNVFILLILFLKYKDTLIRYHQLFEKAWPDNRDDISIDFFPVELMNRLKNAVSNLRRELKQVKGFEIPNARGEGYLCTGDFSFCLILDNTLHPLYTLGEV